MYNSDEDGITHINCYSKGKTELGRFLSNFAHAPFDCQDGHFESIEGYWYWLSCVHERREELRTVYGFKAKELGRELRSEDYPEIPDFQERIWNAVRAKFNANNYMRSLLIQSKLPLVHYYVYGTKVHYDPRSDWLWKRIEQKRNEVQNES